MNRRTQWNHDRRVRLVQALGGKCAQCGVTSNLTFDCIKPTGGQHHRMSSVQRMGYYLAQARRGNVQVLCHGCNSKKGSSPQPRYVAAFLTFLR